MPYSSSNITRSIINQSPSPPPNPLLAAYLSHPLLPFNSDYLESPYLQRVLSLSLFLRSRNTKIRKENRARGLKRCGERDDLKALVNSESDPAESRNSNLGGGASRELNRASSDPNLRPFPPPPS